MSKKISILVLILLISTIAGFAQAPQLINYQGYLIDAKKDKPVEDGTYSIRFSIYDGIGSVPAIWGETHSVQVQAGLYNVMLGSINPIAPFILNGAEKYLGIKIGNDPEMTPRKRIVSVAYAILSENSDKLDGKDASEFTTKTELNTDDETPPNEGSNQVSWNNLKDVPPAFADGIDDVGNDGLNSWSLTGNRGTIPGTNFIGTIENRAFEVKVNNTRVSRLEPTDVSPNLINGFNGNNTATDVKGATISGGGYNENVNRVTDRYGTVAGGAANQAGDDDGSPITANFAAVGGGLSNTASGFYATVPGGSNNTADGENSFAAGRRAKANHNGSFVWADHTDEDFASTADNQFMVRASGGVVIMVGSNKITIDPENGVTIESDSDINFESSGDLSFSAKNINILGDNVDVTANKDFKIQTSEDMMLNAGSDLLINAKKNMTMSVQDNIGIQVFKNIRIEAYDMFIAAEYKLNMRGLPLILKGGIIEPN